MFVFLHDSGAQPLHLQCIDAPFVCLDNREFETTETDLLATARQAAKFVHDKTADSVVLLVLEFAFEVLVKVLYARQRPDSETRLPIAIPVGPDELPPIIAMKAITLPVGNYRLVSTIHAADNTFQRTFAVASFTETIASEVTKAPYEIGNILFEKHFTDPADTSVPALRVITHKLTQTEAVTVDLSSDPTRTQRGAGIYGIRALKS